MASDSKATGTAWVRGYGIEGPTGWWNQYGRPAWVLTGWHIHPVRRVVPPLGGEVTERAPVGEASDSWDWPYGSTEDRARTAVPTPGPDEE